MTPHDATPLDETLQRAKASLKSALTEVCRADIDRADTGELIRVEEVLAIANEAAKEAISVRRRITTQRRGMQPQLAKPPFPSREIEDEHGVRWAAFEVHPSISAERPSVRERFRDGWLAFDSGVDTRRVAPIPPEWRSLADAELLQLLKTAEPATRREERRATERTPPPP